jgi:hypothetical protein
MEAVVLKTLAGFLTRTRNFNYRMSDEGSPVGIEIDWICPTRQDDLHFVNLVNSRLGPQAMTCIHSHFEEHNGKRVVRGSL